MSNSLAKEEVFYEAVRTTFINDNVNTGEDVREMYFYVVNKISTEFKRTKSANPQITMKLEHDGDQDGIPSGNYFFEVKTYISMDAATPMTIIGRIESRMLTLINKQPTVLNLVNPNKNLRCRYIVKSSSIPTVDQVARLHVKITLFRVILDDENID